MEHILYQFLSESLVIPAWQMSVLVVTMGIFMLVGDHKLSTIVTFLFTLYWAFFLYFGDILDSFGTFPATFYVLFGCAHIGLTVAAFTKEKV